LLLVPQYGVVGSAWATVGARLCLALGLVAWVWLSRDATQYGLRGAGRSPSYRALLGVGAAAALSHAAESGAFSGMTMLAGRLGAEAVAGYQILLNLMAIVFMVSLGVSSATAVLTSEATGRRELLQASRASFAGLLLNTMLMVSIGAAVLVFASSIGRAYTANLTLAAFVASVLWLVAVALPPDGAQVVAAAALRARGDNWFPTASHLLSYALVMPALAYWLAEARHHGVEGLMLAILGASVLSCGLLCLRLRHLHRQGSGLPIG
jgi:multidrug resistance protein, MATE family